jgi:hypothetical protein
MVLVGGWVGGMVMQLLMVIGLIAKGFSCVNQLRIIKKVNLRNFGVSLHGWYYDIKIDLSV